MLKLCLFFFQICGFYPVKVQYNSDHQNEKEKKLHQNFILMLWSALHCATVASFMIFVIVFHERMLYSETPIGKINDILVYFSMLFAHFAIIIETFFKRNLLLKFWYHRSKFLQLAEQEKTKRWEKTILSKIFCSVVLTITSECLVIAGIRTDKQWTDFWCVSVFGICLTRFRHLQHIIFIDIIFHSLEDMNCKLKNTTNWTKFAGKDQKFSKKFLYKNVKNIKEQFKNLMEMLICVNKVFCWSQVFNVGQHFVEITSAFFWIYAYATGPKFLWGEIRPLLD
jgi:7tm Chemosensory receptor